MYHIEHVLHAVSQRKATGASSSTFEVLDAGAGTDFISWYLPYVTSGGIHMTALDSDPNNQNRHREISQSYEAEGLGWMNPRFVLGTIQRLPFADAAFDIIFCVSVLEHTSGYDAVVSEFARVLRPGGFLVLSMDVCPQVPRKACPYIPFSTTKQLLVSLERLFVRADSGGLRHSGELIMPRSPVTPLWVRELMGEERWRQVHGTWGRDGREFMVHCSSWVKNKVV